MTIPGGKRLSVLLTTEGTYPYHRGGVSTWCHALTSQLSEVDFTILAVAMHPYLERGYDLTPNVRDVITVPLWGTEDPAEYGWYESAADFLRTRWQTSSGVVGRRFVPIYERFLREAMAPRSQPQAMAETIVRMHEHFTEFDYHRTMTDAAVWDTFAREVTDAWTRADPDHPPASLGEVAEAWRLLMHLLTVLAAPIPETDLTHSAAAAFCGLPCVIAKIRWGRPYLLTEHGAYLREQYLNLGRSIRSAFVRWFLLRVIAAIVDVNYAYADQLTPVCKYNTRWERWRGVEEDRIRVIYNGVDPARFSPAAEGTPRPERPLVVNLGLIFPLKGQLDLIEAAAQVRQSIPDVEFRFYGSPSDAKYYAECQARVKELELEHTVVFAGSTKEPWAVYRRADVVAMASISEGFPYALIEAMLSGSAIVATDVGGVREALATTGLLVNPCDPPAMAKAVIAMLSSPAERRRIGDMARSRALQHFTDDKFVNQYRQTYQQFSTIVHRPLRPVVRPFPARVAVRA
ncbi:MAG: glycosyltransferase [Acidobacteria bacterium]|nr:MAG: glycosyltransferase [Acidobacteriota bacterium]